MKPAFGEENLLVDHTVVGRVQVGEFRSQSALYPRLGIPIGVMFTHDPPTELAEQHGHLQLTDLKAELQIGQERLSAAVLSWIGPRHPLAAQKGYEHQIVIESDLDPFRLERLNKEFVGVRAPVITVVLWPELRVGPRLVRAEVSPIQVRLPREMWDAFMTASRLGMPSPSEQLETAQVQLRQAHEELKGVLESARRATLDIGTARHAAHFDTQAAEHAHQARWWLAATGVFAGATIALAVWNLTVSASMSTTNVPLLFAKVVAFSIAISATLWCAAIYRAHRHNYVVNTHRKNALSSFDAFAAAASDAQTKNAVLIQATQSIFAPQPTGYVKADGDASAAGRVLEIIRSTGEGPG